MENVKLIFSFIQKHALVLLIGVIAAFVYLPNLSGQDYSFDEPETVILARSIENNGAPLAYDNHNFIADGDKIDVALIGGKYFWTWHPWMQHYLTYFGISLFGDSISSARLPFAVMGIGIVLVFYFLCQELFKNKLVSFLLSLQLIFLFPLFLFIRRVRYYSPSILLSLALFYLGSIYLSISWNKKYSVLYAICGTLLFLTNYQFWVATMITFFFLFLKKREKAIIPPIIIQIIIAGAWYIIFKPIGGNVLTFASFGSVLVIKFLQYLSYVNVYIFPFILLPGVFFFSRSKYVFFLVFWIATQLFVSSIFQPVHARFIITIFPLFLLFFGFIYVGLIQKRKKVLVFIIFVIVLLTNILSLPVEKKFFFWPKAFAIELFGKYQSIMPSLGKYMHTRYRNGDLFWSNNFTWNIYVYGKVPSLSTVCDTKKGKFFGPADVVSPQNVRWFIFFQYDNRLQQDLVQQPCLGKFWQENLEKNYHKIYLSYPKHAVFINDQDIVNRAIPPKEVGNNAVVMYERN